MKPKSLPFTPIRLVLLTDMVLIFVGYLSAVLLHYRILDIETIPLTSTLVSGAGHLMLALTCWFGFRIHRRLIRQFAVTDYVQTLMALVAIHVVQAAVNAGILYYMPTIHVLPFLVWLLSFLIASFFLIGSRIIIGYLLEYYLRNRKTATEKRLLIFGASELGFTLKKSIDMHPESGYRVMGYLDDSISKIGKLIGGHEVFAASSNLSQLIKKLKVTDIIIASKTITSRRKAQFLQHTLGLHLRIRELPPLQQWFESDFNLNTIRQLRIEDLLHREPIALYNQEVAAVLQQKVILVTGAAGSIGRELVFTLAKHKSDTIICLDTAESGLYDLQQDLLRLLPHTNFRIVLGDVRDAATMRHLFETCRPQYVFHAAAYKHVPIIEQFPLPGLQTNVLGTWLTAGLAAEYGAEKFVLVSTDKAIEPTSVMGATKRIAEMATQSLERQYPQTEFIITRFGNVLGSNGSVVPLFQKQIQEGGPVTITHPEMKRYFMTIPEAAQLVIEAAQMGRGGEVFIFDMGEPVKIYDLACNMIRLAGLVPERDIKIKVTGMRPGEKLYEDLFSDQEELIKTHHKKIMIGKLRQYSYTEMQKFIAKVKQLQQPVNGSEIRSLIQELVPEYQLRGVEQQMQKANPMVA